MVVRVRAGGDVPPGMVFAPIHWNRAFASDARVGALTNPVVDPISGEPELKHTPVSIEPFVADWYGVMFTRKHAAAAGGARGGRACRASSSCGMSSSGDRFADWAVEARRMLGVPEGADADWIEYRDPARGLYRARVDRRRAARRLHLLRLAGRRCPSAPGWLACSRRASSMRRRARSLWRAARSKAPTRARWCVRVSASGANPIAACARELGAAATPVEIGKRLKCGTNCGSCMPEIQAIIRQAAVKKAIV